MASTKRKPDTEALLSEQRDRLADIQRQIAELDEKRLDTDAATAVKTEIALEAARRDAESRIAQLEKRAADELRQRQAKAQSDLIDRVEAKFAKRDEHVTRLCEHLTAAVTEMHGAMSENRLIVAGWPFDLVIDNEPCLFGKFLRAAIRNELYRLSGRPYVSINDLGDFDFPGAECPTPLGDLRPESVKPLVEKAREASAYASRKMRDAPLRVLPVPQPLQLVEAKRAGNVVEPLPVVTDESKNAVRKDATPEFLYRVDFTHLTTGENRTEEILFAAPEIEEASLDGLGATGPRGQEIALRLAAERVPSEYGFAGKPDSIRLDLARLADSLNRD
jgi:multidrug efflux pump subunit AcrA (membrane-fusion protein)